MQSISILARAMSKMHHVSWQIIICPKSTGKKNISGNKSPVNEYSNEKKKITMLNMVVIEKYRFSTAISVY